LFLVSTEAATTHYLRSHKTAAGRKQPDQGDADVSDDQLNQQLKEEGLPNVEAEAQEVLSSVEKDVNDNSENVPDDGPQTEDQDQTEAETQAAVIESETNAKAAAKAQKAPVVPTVAVAKTVKVKQGITGHDWSSNEKARGKHADVAAAKAPKFDKTIKLKVAVVKTEKTKKAATQAVKKVAVAAKKTDEASAERMEAEKLAAQEVEAEKKEEAAEMAEAEKLAATDATSKKATDESAAVVVGASKVVGGKIATMPTPTPTTKTTTAKVMTMMQLLVKVQR